MKNSILLTVTVYITDINIMNSSENLQVNLDCNTTTFIEQLESTVVTSEDTRFIVRTAFMTPFLT